MVKNHSVSFLKVILIIMVIVLHYFNANMGGLFGKVTSTELNFYISNFIESFCIIAVDCFVLITGFFMYKRNSIKFSKVIKLILTLFILVFFVYILIYIFCDLNLSLKNIISMYLNNVLKDSSWYVWVYCALYLLIPYINELIRSLSDKNLKYLILTLIILFSVFPMVLTDVIIKDRGYGIVNFIMLYIIGAYIGKNFEKLKKKKMSLYVLIYLVCSLVTFLLSISSISYLSSKAYLYNSTFNIIGAISFLCIFLKLNIKENKFFNYISRYTLSIYILHTLIILYQIMWKGLFKCDIFYHSNYMFCHMIFSVCCIFILCLTVSIILDNLILKNIFKLIDRIKLFNLSITVDKDVNNKDDTITT